MKAYLDLLPESKKREILRGKMTRMIISEEISFLIPILVFCALLFSIDLLLNIQLQGIEKVNMTESQRNENLELKKYEIKFSEINERSATIAKVQDFHLEWTGVILKLNDLFPSDIYLTSLGNREYKLFLSGKARQRDSLLGFEEALKASDCFANVNLPRASLVDKENINFQIDMEVNKECLNK